VAQDEQILDVMLGSPGDAQLNTVILSGIDLEVPLEMDLDADPLHDDEVRLLSEDGAYEAVLCASEPDVQADLEKNLYIYRFRSVPPGLYRIQVKTSDQAWATVITDIVVGKKGARIGDTELEDKDPEKIPLSPAAPPAAPAPPSLAEAGALSAFVDFIGIDSKRGS
jgi:hypothetical protein